MASWVADSPASGALAPSHGFPRQLDGATVVIFCDHKFEDMEVMFPKLRLEEAGATVLVVGTHEKGTKYSGKFGYPVTSSMCVDDLNEPIDALVLPGGFAPDYMRRSAAMLGHVTRLMERGVPVAAICHGPWMLCSARGADGKTVANGRRATSFCAIKDDLINAGATYVDKEVVVDGNLITAQTPNDLVPWVQAIIVGVAAQVKKRLAESKSSPRKSN
jgi:protease I